jgi:anaerobic ribonucleoside-triphosphate reductase activating protein
MRKRNLNLLFRGSSNQRLINVPETLKRGEVVLFNEYEYNEERYFEREPMFV